MILDLSKKSISLVKKSIEMTLFDLETFIFYKDEKVKILIKDYKFLKNIISEQEKAFDKIKE